MNGDIIGAIDGAVGDWTTSKDAMRWTPEPQPEPAAGGSPRFAPGWCRITCGDRILYDGLFRDLPADFAADPQSANAD